MAGAKNHDYHILAPDIWPFMGALSALVFTSGMVMYMHRASEAFPAGTWQIVWGLGIAGLIATFWGWFSKIINEAHAGDHTPVVQLHMRYGMILFILSEVMFFVGWFWAFFDFALFPAPIQEIAEGTWQNLIGQEGAGPLAVFPPDGMHVIDPFDLPLLNTLILLCSGTTVTWAHHCLINGDREGLKLGLWGTIALGVLFTAIQAYEYMHAPFGFGVAAPMPSPGPSALFGLAPSDLTGGSAAVGRAPVLGAIATGGAVPSIPLRWGSAVP